MNLSPPLEEQLWDHAAGIDRYEQFASTAALLRQAGDVLLEVKAENERLRAALRVAADGNPSAQAVAKHALGEKP